MENGVHVFAPATVANVACGFDILGFAVDEPGDEVVVRLKNTPGVTISKITGDHNKLSLDPAKNTASVPVLHFLEKLKSKQGVAIELIKKLPFGSGLGSSAASAVASVYAVNELFGKPFKTEELLPFAIEAERMACGVGHADNVAPGLLGGFVLIRSYEPLDIVRIQSPDNLFCSLVHPHIELRTEDARKILRKEISLKDAIIQWGNIAGLIAGLMKPDYGLIGRSLTDVIIEPIRAMLIPGFELVKQAAIGAGALGCSISGSGPTIFALSVSNDIAVRVSVAMAEVFKSLHVDTDVYVSKINKDRPRIIS